MNKNINYIIAMLFLLVFALYLYMNRYEIRTPDSLFYVSRINKLNGKIEVMAMRSYVLKARNSQGEWIEVTNKLSD